MPDQHRSTRYACSDTVRDAHPGGHEHVPDPGRLSQFDFGWFADGNCDLKCRGGTDGRGGRATSAADVVGHCQWLSRIDRDGVSGRDDYGVSGRNFDVHRISGRNFDVHRIAGRFGNGTVVTEPGRVGLAERRMPEPDPRTYRAPEPT